jgi:hypothetical protein
MLPVEGDKVTIGGEEWVVANVDVGMASTKYAMKREGRIVVMDENEVYKHLCGKACPSCGAWLLEGRTLCPGCKKRLL